MVHLYMRNVPNEYSLLSHVHVHMVYALPKMHVYMLTQAKTRVKLNFLESLAKFWELQVKKYGSNTCTSFNVVPTSFFISLENIL